MSAPNFWDDADKAQKITQELAGIKDTYTSFFNLNQQYQDALTLWELGIAEQEDSVAGEVERELASIRAELERQELQTLLGDELDNKNAILTLHAGAGGTEAQDWAQMLLRMYLRYGEKKGYKVEMMDLLDGDEAGIKSAAFRISGRNAYGYLKAEKGVHRLVRISPFDSNARRHTSFAALDVMPEIDDDITVEINPVDLRIDTYRASGAGGQHINKTDSAVRITHIPTGVVVSCQTERSQIQNRANAMTMLRSKLFELERQRQEDMKAEIAGDYQAIEWGSQIRSYVFHPYNMVKDHRTNYETGNVQAVMDGELDGFIEAYLRQVAQEKKGK